MKIQSNLIILLLLIILSCSNENNLTEIETINSKSVTDCGLTMEPDTLVAICLDGAELALPNESLTYAAKFTSTNCEFLWTIESGSMEILNVENSVVDGLTKSIATIKFNTDFSGEGLISVIAEDSMNSGYIEQITELEGIDL